MFGAWLQTMGATEPVYLSAFDLALRRGLAALAAGFCVWAAAETLRRPPAVAD